MNPILITGLFSKKHGRISKNMLQEVETSLQINQCYRKQLIFLAGDVSAARALQHFGLHVHRIFDDAPEWIIKKPAFRMKHWMVYQMLRRHQEVIWIDWDTISLKPLDVSFFEFCRQYQTPKFVYIPGYHATINCSVYYVCQKWLRAMEESFSIATVEANDELMWRSILPKDVPKKKEFWWGEYVVNVWLQNECDWVTSDTYFAHVKTFDYYQYLKPLIV